MTPQRMRVYPIIFLALGLASLVSNVAFGHVSKTLSGQTLLPDYLAHWTGGRLMLNGDMGHLYDPTVQVALQQEAIGGSPRLSWFVSPPFAAVIYAPFALMPYALSAGVWTVVSTALFVAAMFMIRPMLPRLGLQHWGLVLLVVAATQPVLELIGSGQDSALALFLWVAGVRLLNSKKDVLAGVVFALGLFKPQLFVMVPIVLLLQRRLRAFGAWGLSASGLALASIALVGSAGISGWVSLPFTPLYQVEVQQGQAWKMQGVPSLLTSLAPLGSAELTQTVGLMLALVVIAAFTLTLRRVTAATNYGVWAFAGLTTVLASPHLVIYDLVLAVPAFLFLLDRNDERVVRLSLLLLFVITWTTALRHIAAEQVSWPLTVVGAAWSVVPLSTLWAVQYRELRAVRLQGA